MRSDWRSNAPGQPNASPMPIRRSWLNSCFARRVASPSTSPKGARGRAQRRGSLAEVESALELAKDLEYIDATDYARLDAIATETAKTLRVLLPASAPDLIL